MLRVTLPLVGMNFLNQLLRTIGAVIGPDLAVEFQLSAGTLGLIAAVFFAAYGVAQLPIGVALDRFGARRVQSGLAVVAASGALVFALAPGPVWLGVGRVLMGAGVAAGLMAILKAHSAWLPAARIPGMNGIAVSLGALGGAAATLPVQFLLGVTDWRGVFLGLAALGLLVGAVIRVVLPAEQGRPAHQAGHQAGPRPGRLAEVWRSRLFWSLAPAIALQSSINFTYQGLWAGPWLRDVAGFEAETRAQVLLVYALGLVFGPALVGQLATRAAARGRDPLDLMLGCMVGLLVVQLGLLLQWVRGAWLLWALLPAFAGSAAVGYGLVAARFPPGLTGRVVTAINLLMLAVTFGLQTAIGGILDLWPRTATGGWEAAGYAWAIGLTLAAQAGATLWFVSQRGRAGPV